MTACLHDPQDGYYATRPALGEDGDFITAPLVSQMFGELIGVWAISAWQAMGAPARFVLAEIGPGDGTLMSDLLRAGRLAPAFLDAADVWLVETSEPLADLQHERLGDAVRWARSLDEIPGGEPMILVANELLDCLPVRQFVRTATGWAEQVVGLGPDDGLILGLVPAGIPLPDAREGVIWEVSAAQEALGAALGERLVRDGGAALLIDYGRDQPGFGDTLQALVRHERTDPLACPGEADLTVHADFPAVRAAAERTGARSAILTQAAFLARLGIGERAETLMRSRPDKSEVIGRQLNRLIAGDQMGDLFKACCLYAPGWTPPAFDED
ncbi:MAG: SAM-dependent methyltransferase [Alphaproteobacteria bacterium]|nr:SAM-dependent methyltransferase [Alphaproteobacteria bacterium]MBU1515700.1 SAM-dependent methyltransferase [Alphaproteobacteria bacterium]MBU2096983.1 SAM-dependent methyltransferase [Alphaproteobacteria bacterium]MBU2149499.1 SAM-dependent methyltransferase [Alphaproteobacteria bacterium]MBU2308885.1 SAM-dependent methyltransferase [Alphaproteobacteria bacterium]